MQSCFKVTNPSLHWETWGSPLGYFGRGRGGDGGSFSHLGPQEWIEHPLSRALPFVGAGESVVNKRPLEGEQDPR